MRRKRVIGTALAASCLVWLVGWIGTLAGISTAYHVENIGWTLICATAAACGFSAALESTSRRARLSFGFLGAGVLAWGFGQVAWTVYSLQGVVLPYPSLSDVGYLAAMPLLAVGVLTWPRKRRVWTARRSSMARSPSAQSRSSPTPSRSSRSWSRAWKARRPGWASSTRPPSLRSSRSFSVGCSSTDGPTVVA